MFYNSSWFGTTLKQKHLSLQHKFKACGPFVCAVTVVQMWFPGVTTERQCGRCLLFSSQSIGFFFSSFIQINFDPRSMECKYTLINMGEMISSELWWAEINRGSDGSKLQFWPSGDEMTFKANYSRKTKPCLLGVKKAWIKWFACR